ncbi:MAG: rhomboid family intramembrane serine protease [Planctomycetaceae bacterium]|nr:rhomboid family intramembrane serine protease [Planctomycetaceae bacterium]MCP4463245.1 rhomboid family intramembrane serine protease [Planctomycetaceae bacterium]MDG1807527.1 rhomboid family intramembrane serine protease [Pirellulaceae bacterium]MDG2105813.1 rhomboid family intramembrane serine protease [Pirellulaceae bacterium]
MRLIGSVDNQQQAERISAYLMTHEIGNHVEQGDPRWQVWVKDEDALDRAKVLLAEFQANPNDVKYHEAVDLAQKIMRANEKKLQQAKANRVQMTSDRWTAPIHKTAPFTVTLVVICVIVALFMTNLGEDKDGVTMRSLSFCSISGALGQEIVLDAPPANPVEVVNGRSWDNRLRLASLQRGEVWRTITPIFIHFGIMHLLFNMYMLVYFARQIEYRHSAIWLAALVVLTAVPSNMVQCLTPEQWDGAAIANYGNHWSISLGGMSGVIYGLFGYIWMKSTFDPKAGMYVSMSTIVILLVWLVLCMSPGFIQNVANWAHGIGLVTGMAIGYFPKLLSDLGLKK